MDIGIGLPATIPWTNGPLTLEWAKQADSGPFAPPSLCTRGATVLPEARELPRPVAWMAMRRSGTSASASPISSAACHPRLARHGSVVRFALYYRNDICPSARVYEN